MEKREREREREIDNLATERERERERWLHIHRDTIKNCAEIFDKVCLNFVGELNPFKEIL